MRLSVLSVYVRYLGLSALLAAGCDGAFSPYELVKEAPADMHVALTPPPDASSTAVDMARVVEDMTPALDLRETDYLDYIDTIINSNFDTPPSYSLLTCTPGGFVKHDNSEKNLEITIPQVALGDMTTGAGNCVIEFPFELPWVTEDYLQTEFSIYVHQRIMNDGDSVKISLIYRTEPSDMGAEEVDSYDIVVGKPYIGRTITRVHYRAPTQANAKIKRLGIKVSVERQAGRAVSLRIDNLRLTAKTRFPKRG